MRYCGGNQSMYERNMLKKQYFKINDLEHFFGVFFVSNT